MTNQEIKKEYKENVERIDVKNLYIELLNRAYKGREGDLAFVPKILQDEIKEIIGKTYTKSFETREWLEDDAVRSSLMALREDYIEELSIITSDVKEALKTKINDWFYDMFLDVWFVSEIKELERKIKKIDWLLLDKIDIEKGEINNMMVERAREASKEIEIWKRFMELHQKNEGWWGLCPKHNDHTPSLLVKNGFCYCFVCEYNADLLGYLMEIKGMSFKEAVKGLQ